MIKFCGIYKKEDEDDLEIILSNDLDDLTNSLPEKYCIFSIFGYRLTNIDNKYGKEKIEKCDKNDYFGMEGVFISLNEDEEILFSYHQLKEGIYLFDIYSILKEVLHLYYINFDTEEIIDLSEYCTDDDEEAYDNSIAILESLDMDYYDN